MPFDDHYQRSRPCHRPGGCTRQSACAATNVCHYMTDQENVAPKQILDDAWSRIQKQRENPPPLRDEAGARISALQAKPVLTPGESLELRILLEHKWTRPVATWETR